MVQTRILDDYKEQFLIGLIGEERRDSVGVGILTGPISVKDVSNNTLDFHNYTYLSRILCLEICVRD